MKKRILLLAAVVLLTGALCSCGKKKPVLHIYSWGDYVSEDVVRQFEKENDCEVRIDVFDSNEAMYAKLKAGAGGYDLVVPSSYMAEVMKQQNMLQNADHAKLPNVMKYIDRSYIKYALDPEMKYAIPYFASFTGIGYNKKKVKDFKPSWHMFERDDLNKHCSLLNDHREVLGAALNTLGYSVNTTNQAEIDAAVALAREWKKRIAKFEVDDARRALAAGEFLLIQTYSGDMLQIMSENPDFDFVIPEEGSQFTLDNFVIMKDAANPDLAHKFIDFIYRPEICAENMNEIMYVTPHTEAVSLVDESIRNNPVFMIPEEVRARCTALLDLGAENAKYVRAWEEIKK